MTLVANGLFMQCKKPIPESIPEPSTGFITSHYYCVITLQYTFVQAITEWDTLFIYYITVYAEIFMMCKFCFVSLMMFISQKLTQLINYILSCLLCISHESHVVNTKS